MCWTVGEMEMEVIWQTIRADKADINRMIDGECRFLLRKNVYKNVGKVKKVMSVARWWVSFVRNDAQWMSVPSDQVPHFNRKYGPSHLRRPAATVGRSASAQEINWQKKMGKMTSDVRVVLS